MFASAKTKVTKVDSTATVSTTSVLIISHITFRDCRVHSFFDNLSRNSCVQRNLDTTKAQGTGKICSL